MLFPLRAPLRGSVVTNPPAMQEPQETQVQSLGWEDPLAEKMATYSSILAWEIPWTKEPGGLQSMESKRDRHSWAHTCTLATALVWPSAISPCWRESCVHNYCHQQEEWICIPLEYIVLKLEQLMEKLCFLKISNENIKVYTSEINVSKQLFIWL